MRVTQPEYLPPLILCDYCESATHTSKAQDLVCVRVLRECFGVGGSHDLYIGAIAHELDNIVVSDASATRAQCGQYHEAGESRMRGATGRAYG